MISEPIVEALDETESLSLIAGGGVGRIGYTSRFGPAVLPVNYDLHEQTIVFRTGLHSAMVEDLRTGIADAEYNVAFEIDHLQPVTQEGWSVLVQGAAHFVDSEEELASVAGLAVEAWAGGPKEQFIRIIPRRITGGASGGPPKQAPASPWTAESVVAGLGAARAPAATATIATKGTAERTREPRRTAPERLRAEADHEGRRRAARPARRRTARTRHHAVARPGARRPAGRARAGPEAGLPGPAATVQRGLPGRGEHPGVAGRHSGRAAGAGVAAAGEGQRAARHPRPGLLPPLRNRV